MDRDSEVETVLADDDWFLASAEGTSAASRNSRRRNRHEGSEGRRAAGAIEASNDFDEEELFSPSGSLSSLHEFSGSDDAQSDDSAGECGVEGPIIRSGIASSARKQRLGDTRVDAGTPAAQTESEIDVDGDDTRSALQLKTARIASALPGLSPSSTWQVHRGRKVIADEDDEDDDGRVASVAADDGDIEDGPDSRQRRKKQRLEHSIRRMASAKADATSGERSNPLAGAGTSVEAQADALLRKPKSANRRKPRYDEPDCADDDGCPQLVYFAAKGDTAICRKLLLHGASISRADSHGWTALHEATKQSHVETLELLLAPPTRARIHSDAEVGSECSSANTEQHVESRIVRQLLSPLPNINATTQHLRLTPLHQAVMNEDMLIVRMLLDHGARTCVSNSRQLTPLDTCSNEKIVRLLTERAKMQRSISARDKAGQTKLHRACNAGDLKQTISLINQGADVNMKDNAGWTPLHEAALEGHNAVVVALLRRGADYSARGFGGDTPLHDACANGHVDVARSLMVVGADPHAKNLKHVTPEDMAKEEEQEEVLQIIDLHRRGLLREPQRSAQGSSGGASAKKGMPGKGKRPAGASRSTPLRSDDASDQEPSPGKDRSRLAQRLPPPRNDQGEQRPASARSNYSDNQSTGGASAHKRELVSLRRLRQEAEKPQVNYYFSSNSSKMSRDERKLQVLVGTIERMEKRKPKEKDKRQTSVEPEPSNNGASASAGETADNNGDGSVKGVGRHHHFHQRDLPDPSSSSLSPKRRRGRPPKKRIIDDEDDDKESPGLVSAPVSSGVVRHVVKRAKHETNSTAAGLTRGDGARGAVITIDGTSKPRHVPSSIEAMRAAPSTPTVEIKSEPQILTLPTSAPSTASAIANDSVAAGQPALVSGSTSSKQMPRHGGTSGMGLKDKQHAKHHRAAEGGRTIVESSTVHSQRAETMTPSSIAAQAIRYLPLYTIQLHSDPPALKPDYFVVDMQVRLLLGMPIDTANGVAGTNGSSRRDSNLLFVAYPHLYRQQISRAQKERLWEPLAGMFVSNMQYIHSSASTMSSADGASEPAPMPGKHTTDKKAAKRPAASVGPRALAFSENKAGSAAKADDELVSQFTLHEKKKFVALGLHFVKLDEVVEIIRRDYPQIGKQLITISLDLSNVSIAATTGASVSSPSTSMGLTGVSSGSAPLRSMADVADRDKPKPLCPSWTGPQKMLPLRYALKLHYRDQLAFVNGTSAGNGGAKQQP
ncbi:hypothetical protein GGI04_003451 [Coemansia thaxteri]|nr:hypothetical protein GGI04_003451 [Coemansia thaxteri]